MGKILIVDDLATEVQLMRSTVTGMGHQPVVAESGEQALELLKRERPSLVLLDIVLPGMDGFAVCRKIKKDPETSNIPVILCSSKSMDSDKFWGMKQGASDYLCKPFTPEILSTAVKKLLS